MCQKIAALYASVCSRLRNQGRAFLLAFGGTFCLALLLLAAFLLYQWGYESAIQQKGTYDAGYAAAIEKEGTWQQGYDDAIKENGTYEDGYTSGYTIGRQEGYKEGHAAGYTEGKGEGFSEGYDSGTSAATRPDSAHARVWVSRLFPQVYHSTPNCGLLLRPREMTLTEAEAAGYTKCDQCW